MTEGQKDILRQALDAQGVELPEDELEDLLQDIVTAGVKAGDHDTLSMAGLLNVVPDIGVDDGILVLLFSPNRVLRSHVVRYGKMNEAILDANLMSVYQGIMRARATQARQEIADAA